MGAPEYFSREDARIGDDREPKNRSNLARESRSEVKLVPIGVRSVGGRHISLPQYIGLGRMPQQTVSILTLKSMYFLHILERSRG